MSDDRERRFHFGARDQQGMFATIQPLQVLVLTLGAVSSVATVRLMSSHGRFVLALAQLALATVLAFVRVARRPLISWVAELWRFAREGLSGNRRIVYEVAGGRPSSAAARLFGAFQVLEIEHAGRHIGAVHDRVDRTLSVVLPVQGGPFVLLDEADRAQRVAAWSSLLAALNNDKSVYRLKWISQSVPDVNERYHARVVEAARREQTGHRKEALDSYRDLCDVVQSDALRVDQFMVVSTRAPRSFAQRTRSGSSDLHGIDLAEFVKQVLIIERRLSELGLKVAGASTKLGITKLIQRLFDDSDRLMTRRDPWPAALEERWECIRTDNLWHATYWIAEWPRMSVPSGFLLPLLVDANVRRNVSMCMSPVHFDRATRAVERKRISSVADVELRRRYGFALSSRVRAQHEAVIQREEELAQGHVAFEFSGYVTVSAGSIEELQRSCEQVEHLCSMSHVEVRRLYGMQRESLLFGLGNARGCA